ncbi:MAG: hypothetical protein PWQ39_1501 [Thermacetogenium sp.]|nr:hypothetical protein [Thermacetogenium sp.]
MCGGESVTLIRRYLQTGVMVNGVVMETAEGTKVIMNYPFGRQKKIQRQFPLYLLRYM